MERTAADGASQALPDGFASRLRGMLGAEADACLAALADPPAGLRVNTLRLSPQRFVAIAPFELEALPHPTAGFRVLAGARPGRHPYHAAGLYYLQDPGAMAVAALLAPQPGERVLDLAAAPGGKATHLAALMQDRGVLVANDVHGGRVRELAGNLERLGVTCAVVTREPIDRLAAQLGAAFDRVLLDAPCSGESMFAKSEAARAGWSVAAVQGCARRQHELLQEAAQLVRPGGRLMYSTCTFSAEENEEVVARFLRERPDFEPVPLGAVPGADAGRVELVPSELRTPELRHTLRLWPHRVAGAGHFVAGLRRHDGAPAHVATRPAARSPAQQRTAFDEFVRDALPGLGRLDGDLELRGDELYLVPPNTPALGRLRTVRPGWWLGTLRARRFEPSHALALAVPPAAAARTLALRAGDPATLAYLRGETLSRAGPPGWLLVTVDGFAIGWGKRVGAQVKNHYPKGLRRR